MRARSGYDIKQLASEYRALRASVLSMWMEACLPAAPPSDDVIRFNEAIDQALAESIGHFSQQVDQARNLLLGMLSHDMRSPLQTVQMTAQYLGQLNAGSDVSTAAARLIRSGADLQALLDDLVDFNRTNLGLGIRIVPSPVDLGAICGQELEQLRVANPDTRLELNVGGDCQGSWDGRRVKQLLGNLVINAIHHGVPDAPVRVAVVGEKTGVRIDVTTAVPQSMGRLSSSSLSPLSGAPLTNGILAWVLACILFARSRKVMAGLRKRAPTIMRRCSRCDFRATNNRSDLYAKLGVLIPVRRTARQVALDTMKTKTNGSLGSAGRARTIERHALIVTTSEVPQITSRLPAWIERGCD